MKIEELYQYNYYYGSNRNKKTRLNNILELSNNMVIKLKMIFLFFF